MTTLIKTKSLNEQDRSDSILVSFKAATKDQLLDRSFTAIIRKRVPRTMEPRWIYFHVNTPVSAICARAHISEIKVLSVDEAVEIAAMLDMTESSIRNYARSGVRSYVGSNSDVGCYFISEFQMAAPCVGMSTLRTRLEYHPPQSFLVLSVQAKRVIDEFAGFRGS